MSRQPTTSEVACPTCGGVTYAVVPQGSITAETGEPGSVDYDGKVWTTCHHCHERFVVFYQIDE